MSCWRVVYSYIIDYSHYIYLFVYRRCVRSIDFDNEVDTNLLCFVLSNCVLMLPFWKVHTRKCPLGFRMFFVCPQSFLLLFRCCMIDYSIETISNCLYSRDNIMNEASLEEIWTMHVSKRNSKLFICEFILFVVINTLVWKSYLLVFLNHVIGKIYCLYDKWLFNCPWFRSALYSRATIL